MRTEATFERRQRTVTPRTSTWILVGVIALALTLSCLFVGPTVPWSGRVLPSGAYGGGFGDPAQMTWFLNWMVYALAHAHNPFFTTAIDYPHGVNLADATLVPFLGLLGAPLTATLGPVATFNVLLRLAYASSTVSMFWALRHWCRWPAALLGALVYGFGPYTATQGQNHLDLVFVPLPPLLVWCAYELLARDRYSSRRLGVLLGVLAAVQVYVDPEILTMSALVGAVALIVFVVRDRPGRLRRWRRLRGALTPAFAVFAALSVFWLWPLLFARGHLHGPVLALAVLQSYRADLLGPITPSVNQLIGSASMLTRSSRYINANQSENVTYLGVPLVLLLIGFGVAFRHVRAITYSALLAALAFVLSLGSRLSINAHVTALPLPEALVAHVPLVNDIVPARFGFVVALCASISFAVGVDQFWRYARRSPRSSRSPRLAVIVTGVLIVSAVACLLPRWPLRESAPPWSAATPAALRNLPTGSVVLTYPFTTDPWTEAMSWQIEDSMRFRLVGGYATTQDATTHGNAFAPLLRPAFVQEFLSAAQFGAATQYPAPSRIADGSRLLCSFVERYGVDAVVLWQNHRYDGVRPGLVRRLFLATFGRPTFIRAQLATWLQPSLRCATRFPTRS